MSTKEDLNKLRSESLSLARAAPKAMSAFQGLMKAANEPELLGVKLKELTAVAISVSVRCDGCIAFHVQNAVRHGATREELVELLAVAIEMGGGPATIYAGKALAAFDELQGTSA